MLGLKEAVEGLLSLASTVRADATACDSTGSDLDGDTARECTEDSRTRLSCSEDDLSAGATVGSWGAKRMRTGGRRPRSYPQQTWEEGGQVIPTTDMGGEQVEAVLLRGRRPRGSRFRPKQEPQFGPILFKRKLCAALREVFLGDIVNLCEDLRAHREGKCRNNLCQECCDLVLQRVIGARSLEQAATLWPTAAEYKMKKAGVLPCLARIMSHASGRQVTAAQLQGCFYEDTANKLTANRAALSALLGRDPSTISLPLVGPALTTASLKDPRSAAAVVGPAMALVWPNLSMHHQAYTLLSSSVVQLSS